MRTPVTASIDKWRATGVALGLAVTVLAWQGLAESVWTDDSDDATAGTPTAVVDAEADRAALEPVASLLAMTETIDDESSTGDAASPATSAELDAPIERDVVIDPDPDVDSASSDASLYSSPTSAPAPDDSPDWSSIWRPFLSERTASGFAEYIGEATGLTLRVGEPDDAGRYEVEVEHRSDAERLAAIERIVQATGYRPAER